jgi:hypothetical protein
MTTYTLPTASTTTLGGVKVDGTTITVNNGVISSASSGSFISPSLTGTTTVQHIAEIVTNITGATGTVVHDFNSASSLFYHTNVANDFTVNFTNVPTTNGRSYIVTLVLIQGNAAYIPHAVSIDGVSQNLFWSTNAQPVGAANKKEFFSFTLIRQTNSWIITASVATFG